MDDKYQNYKNPNVVEENIVMKIEPAEREEEEEKKEKEEEEEGRRRCCWLTTRFRLTVLVSEYARLNCLAPTG